MRITARTSKPPPKGKDTTKCFQLMVTKPATPARMTPIPAVKSASPEQPPLYMASAMKKVKTKTPASMNGPNGFSGPATIHHWCIADKPYPGLADSKSMPGDAKPTPSRLFALAQSLPIVVGILLIAAFLEAPQLVNWLGPIVAFVILGLLLVPMTILVLMSTPGTFQFRSAQANLSAAAGLFLVLLFLWLISEVRDTPIILAVLLFALVVPGLTLALTGYMLRPFLLAEWMATWLDKHRHQIVPHLTHKNFHRLFYVGLIVAGAGAYAIGPPLPVGVSPLVPWYILVVGLNIAIVALTLDHELVPKGAK